jgi:hypothetical protein
VNCWEFMKCGRQAGGEKVHELGVCPAYPDSGNICARIVGTMCRGRVQGMFAEKFGSCLICDFYNSRHYGSLYRDEQYMS